MTQTQMDFTGAELRDQALTKHHQNHKAHIHAVRMALLAGAKLAGSVYLTGDDASLIADQMQIPGDRRFLGAVFKGWDRVKSTGRYQNSRLPQRHARPVAIWAIV